MAQIRQEINILDHILSAASGSTGSSSERVQLDTTQYNGTVTYYYEIITQSTASISYTVTLRRTGTTTDDATITVPLGTTAYTRLRSTAFTAVVGQKTYFTFIDATAGATKNVKSSKIIVIQNATTLTNTETQIEVGDNMSTTSLTDVPLTNPKYWLYTSANWDGTITAYFEATILSGTSKSAATVTLQVDDGSFASWANVSGTAVATIETLPQRVRSSSFTLTAGRHYRVVVKAGNSKSGATIYNAKIVVQQLAATTTNIYYFNASQAGPTDADSVWTNDANAFDGNTGTVATILSAISGSDLTKFLRGDGTTAPTSGNSIYTVEARIYGRAMATIGQLISKIYTISLGEVLGTCSQGSNILGYSIYSTLTKPAAGWTWQTIHDLVVKTYDSNTAHVNDTDWAITELLVTSFTNSITKLEPQYLLLNKSNTGTGLQAYQTLYDADEWSGVTNVYQHAQDASNAADSSKLRDITLGADVGSSTVTGANQQISSALTFTDNSEIDVSIITATGVIAASRILVAVAVNAAAPSTTAPVEIPFTTRRRPAVYSPGPSEY